MRSPLPLWTGNVCAVLQHGDTYRIVVHDTGYVHSVEVGTTPDRDQALRCAKRLDKHPANARRFAGLFT